MCHILDSFAYYILHVNTPQSYKLTEITPTPKPASGYNNPRTFRALAKLLYWCDLIGMYVWILGGRGQVNHRNCWNEEWFTEVVIQFAPSPHYRPVP